ncbi:hypothetical protein LSH36_21g02014 [Paralvinella palmiformis]|uniref:Uncharacterized protein n=1 Tax=Paralvinella palmiformis TaxID=53620 RepID=A0AAD9NF61_9ANNE|nr:hypothetical protein LSH36_21g02014 [Paralvinella palmiformis]
MSFSHQLLAIELANLRWTRLYVGAESARPFVNHPTCPRDPEAAKERRCFKKCLSDDDCKAKRKCMCDGPCGMICVKPRKRCKDLEAIANGRVVPLQVGNNMTFGSKIRYTCAEGYILSGYPERVCQADGIWSGQAPTCETEARCREPPWVPHATHDDVLDQKFYPLGTQLTYRCDKGHIMEGFHRSLCMGEGRWVGPRMTCTAVRCGHPGNILHADRDGNVFVYPYKVKYTCRGGYRMVGSSDRGIRYCQDNGKWSGTPPTCIPIKCPRLLPPINGSMIGSDITYGAVARFFCQVGFKLVGSPSRQCRMDGTWSGKDATCTVVDCGLPGPLYNGYLEIEGTTYKSKITFKCNGRTTFEGVGIETRCLQNGSWSVGIPKCWKKCQVPGVVNGTIIGEQEGAYTDHGKTLQYHCNRGHQRNTTEGPKCYNGTWTFYPKCIPEEIRDGHVRFYTMRHGDKARYKCNTGYYLVGKEFVTCEYGEWRGQVPTCAPVFCEHPGSIENGKILLVGVIGKYEYRPYVKNVWHNQEIEYHCDKEYKRVGPAAATCVGGKWSPPKLPKCIQKHHPKILYIFRGKRSVDNNNITALEEDVVSDEKGLCEVPDIPHGHVFNYPTGYYVPHTSVLKVSCDQGYTLLSGQGQSRCDDGMWTWIPGCLPESPETEDVDELDLGRLQGA